MLKKLLGVGVLMMIMPLVCSCIAYVEGIPVIDGFISGFAIDAIGIILIALIWLGTKLLKD